MDTARSGGEALGLLRRKRYDVVVTDLAMEGVNGLEILRAAKETDPDACVVVVTGHSNEDAGIRALREGADDYLFKPFQPEEFVLRVRKRAETRELRRRLRQCLRLLGVCPGCFKMRMADPEGGRWIPWEALSGDQPEEQTLCPACRRS